MLNAVRCPYVRSSVTLGVASMVTIKVVTMMASSVANDVIMRMTS